MQGISEDSQYKQPISNPQYLSFDNCQNWLEILKSSNLSQLDTILFHKSNIGDEGLKDLLKIISQKIKTLRLSECRITSRGIQAMMQCSNLLNLKDLRLADNNIGNTGMKWLVKCHLPNIKGLFLVNNQISGEGFKHIIKSIWPQLQSLILSYHSKDNKIQINGSEILFQNTHWNNLSLLYLCQKQAICCINLILLCLSIEKVKLLIDSIENKELSTSIKKFF